MVRSVISWRQRMDNRWQFGYWVFHGSMVNWMWMMYFMCNRQFFIIVVIV